MTQQSFVKEKTSLKWTMRIIGFIWMFLTACFAILNIFIFVQPQWIGDSLASPRAGHFGLYSYCISTIDDYEFECHGIWLNFRHIINAPFAVATFFVGLSVLLILLCLVFFLFFIFLRSRFVYFLCSLIQMFCSISLLVALIVYPSGFDHETIRTVCGDNAKDFHLDTCQIRWAYILAMIACFNVTILAILGFILGTKHDNQGHTKKEYGELSETSDERTVSERTSMQSRR